MSELPTRRQVRGALAMSGGIDRFMHGQALLQPYANKELMTRAEWGATVDYERGIGWLHIDMCPQEPTNSTEEYWAMLHRTVKGIVNAALNVEEDDDA